MKITNYNTALGLLTKMDAHQWRIISDDNDTTIEQKRAMCLSIIDKWPNLQPLFSKKIQYISHPFYEAYEKAAGKMGAVLDQEEIDESGTFIFKASESETNTIFYTLKTTGKDAAFEMDATIMIFNSDTKKDKPALGILVQRRPGMPAGGARQYFSKNAIKAGVTAISVMADIFTLILFMKYCELETKDIKAGKKDIHIGIKYVNDTSSNIQILDSTWFTTIVRSEGFHVRGHFRFQPCGQGMKDRKLIWISDFDKTGYTKTAKILNTQ